MTDAERVARLARPHTYCEDRLGMKLHPKHTAVLKDVFRKGSRVSARCANEVGKTSTIATGAILFALEILGAQAISTAGVWMQVAQQLVPNLKRHSHRFPSWSFQETNIKIDGIDRYVGFSTRDEGFAQGFHRRPGMPLLAIVDEAAAVGDKIIAGVEDRCNPDYFLIMGSPKSPSGLFHRIETTLAAHYTHHHISQMDCLVKDGYWLEQAAIERKIAKWGRDHPFTLSNIFGEFADLVEGAMLSLSEFDACLFNPPKWEARPNERHAFVDFAAGRNKNVFAVRIGNKVWIEKKWADRNTMSACGEVLAIYNRLHQQYGLLPEEVDGDADGLGLPMIQRLEEMGFPIGHFHGGKAPRFDKEYADEISEAWGEGAGKIKRMELILPDDLDFKAQALGRKLKRNSLGLFKLEPKEEMVKRGLESPDEADAVYGASMPAKLRHSQPVMGERRQPEETKDSLWGRPDTNEHDREREHQIPGAHFG